MPEQTQWVQPWSAAPSTVAGYNKANSARGAAPQTGADPSEEEGPRQVIARLNTLVTIAGKYFGQGADLDLDLGAGEATRRHEADD